MPVTRGEFRRMALSFPETEERAHMSHPDFRVCGKIFATLGYPNKESGMVKLTPEQQQELMHDDPGTFDPCSGAWGRQGSTSVRLKSARKATLLRALEAAWHNAAPKKLAQTWNLPAPNA